jgi:hypothetical protein
MESKEEGECEERGTGMRGKRMMNERKEEEE